MIKDDIDKILEFQKERDWKQFHSPKNLAISLSLEASEVLELFQWTKDGNLPEERRGRLAEELADVYYYLLLLAHETGIDIKSEFQKKMEINENKYPVDKSKGTSKKYNEL
ncbi:nucleotide pyrophosphohydrolase [Chloroflexota bacterium]